MFTNLSANLQSKAGDDPSVALYNDQTFKDAFFKLVSSACAVCFNGGNKKKQMIKMRYVILECFEKSQGAQHYLSKVDDERQILAERFFSPATKIDLDSQCFLDNQLYQSAALVFRGLSGKYFGDFKHGDWFVVLSASARRVIKYRMDCAIHKAQGSPLVAVMEMALQSFEQEYREVSEVVFAGGNYNVNPVDFEESPPPKEVPSQKPANKTAVYSDERDRLVDIVTQRMEATAEGRYYFFDQFVPASPFKCAAIDMACVWISIGHKLGDSNKAKAYAQEIVGRAYERKGVDTEDERFKQCFETAEAIASAIMDKPTWRRDGWFATFLVTAFAYVYDKDISNSPAKAEQQRELGAQSLGLGAHLWPLHADIVNGLGGDVSRDWLGQSDPGAQ